MLAGGAETLRIVDAESIDDAMGYIDGVEWFTDSGDWPDFRDPATVGCLLALVREIHGAAVHTTPDNTGCGWWVEGLPRSLSGSRYMRSSRFRRWGIGIIHATEAEALVAALEATND
jgi:hypothetical protein